MEKTLNNKMDNKIIKRIKTNCDRFVTRRTATVASVIYKIHTTKDMI